jgi:hypothetical protein
MPHRRRIILLVVGLALALVASAPVSVAAEVATYRTRDFDLRPLEWRQLSFHGWPTPPLPAPPPTDADGIVLFRWNGRYYYRPAGIASNGIKRLDAYVRFGRERQLDQALLQARRLRQMAHERREAWWLPYEFDFPPRDQHAPWYDAMAQGITLSFFVRLHRVTGDVRHLKAARRVFASFVRLGRSRAPWVSYVSSAGYLWLEHYPAIPSHHVLNAHNHAVFGLFDFWQETRDDTARRLLVGAITTIRANIRLWREPGEVSRYCINTRCQQSVHYHAIHIWQLRQLARMTRDPFFGTMADRFNDDYSPARPGNGVPGRCDMPDPPNRCPG